MKQNMVTINPEIIERLFCTEKVNKPKATNDSVKNYYIFLSKLYKFPTNKSKKYYLIYGHNTYILDFKTNEHDFNNTVKIYSNKFTLSYILTIQNINLKRKTTDTFNVNEVSKLLKKLFK